MIPHKSSSIGAYVAGVIIGCGVILATASILAENEHSTVCKNEETVLKILEVNYRSATVLLSDGSKRTVNQASFSPGDKFCTYWGVK